jgi:hypothetical protein
MDLVVANSSSSSLSLLMGTAGPRAPFKCRYTPGRRPFADGSVAAEGARDHEGAPPPIHLALEGFRPNPTRVVPVVAFTLVDDSPAVIEVLDVAGRRLFRRDVGGLGAGRHVIGLGVAASLRPGAYLLRLQQAGRTLAARGVVIR